MLYPSINDLIKPGENRYSFVIAVAKRARAIAEKAEANGEILTEKPVKIAINEFYSGKLVMKTDSGQPENSQ